MRRIAIGLLFAASVVASLGAVEASQVNPASQIDQTSHRRNPQRFQRGSWVEYIVVPRDGKPAVRQVYSGYSSRFPRPAFLYYGYPHSGDDTGIGPLDRR
jgi:hypothetical protein